METVDFTLDFIYDAFGALLVSGLTYDLTPCAFIIFGGTSVFCWGYVVDACVAAGTVFGGGSVEAACSTVSGLFFSSTVCTACAGRGSNLMSELPTCAAVLSRTG